MADPEKTLDSLPASNNETTVPLSIETGDETLGEQKFPQVEEEHATEEEHPKEVEVLTPPPQTHQEKNANVPPAASEPPNPRNTMFQRALAKVIEEEEEIEKAAELKEQEDETPKGPVPVVEPPPPEIRAAAYVTRPSPKILYKIDRELRDGKYYLMGKRAFGDPKAPASCSFFVMGDIGKRYEVKIRQFSACQCGDFLEDRLCKHMMFIMLKFFKLKKYDPLNWQRAFLSTELRTLLSDPRITYSAKVEAKKKFVSKLFPPKVAPAIHPDEDLGSKGSTEGPQTEKELGPQFCPVCLEQFNFIAETPKVPYIGPIPWKPKFMPKLDMTPPKSIQELKDQKASLDDAMKKHEEETAFAKQGETNVEIDASKQDLVAEQKVENKDKLGGEEAKDIDTKTEENSQENSQENNEGKTAIVLEGEEKKDENADSSPPLRKYEPIWFCLDSDCKGDATCFKLVHEWCYKKFDNYGIYPRGKQCPTFSSL
ncbi:unnamed protein product [Calypogeia fissa]